MTTSTLVVKDLTRRGLGLGENLGRWDLKYSPYLFVSPFFILFALVGLFPLLYTAWVALHAWDLLGGQGRWTGFDNFAFILQQRQFWVALRNTLSIFLLPAVPDWTSQERGFASFLSQTELIHPGVWVKHILLWRLQIL